MRSVMEHSFSQVPRANIPRSSFNRSHGYKTAFDADFLIPVLVDDVVPGDTFNVNMHFFSRLATPLFPIMDNMYLESFFFFVPYRLVWDNWKKMHGEQVDPGDSISYTTPQVSSPFTIAEGDLFDFFGLPTIALDTDYIPVTALPGRAYGLIWNDWFRDQNLQDSLTITTDDGPDTPNDTDGANVIRKTPLKRGKRHDYFTSCLPWPQKGDAVEIFSSTTAEVRTSAGVGQPPGVYSTDDSDHHLIDTGVGTVKISATVGTTAETDKMYANIGAATINDLRLAFQTQKLLERDARSGTRYNELILSHFGVTVPDFRIQRPEFLGGGSTPVNITPVANTSDTVSYNQGELTGFGTVSGRHGFTKSFVEHGVIIGLVNVRSDITYSQGVERYWQKETRYDFYYPVLAHIGEQAVLNGELFASGNTNDDNVFGYQERYAEMRYKPSKVTNHMSPQHSGTLAAWHLTEAFGGLPTLDSTFITSNTGTPLDRAIAAPSEPHFIFDAYFDMKCARPMPLYGVPGNLDHF